MATMKINVKKGLRHINTAMTVISAAQFTWGVVEGVLHWYHQGEHHHSISLTEAQRQHLIAGGTLECEYDCGTILRAGK
jgi:hypothetical protein